MPAELIKLGDPPPTWGGEEEGRVVAQLVRDLSDRFAVVAAPTLPTRTSYFYDLDIIVASANLCEVVEVKASSGWVHVDEHRISAANGFVWDDVFGPLERKGHVLRSRLAEPPFNLRGYPVGTRVVMGPSCPGLDFTHQLHRVNKKVMTCAQAVRFYRDHETDTQQALGTDGYRAQWHAWRDAWRTFAQNLEAHPNERHARRHRLGRFLIQQRLAGGPPRCYRAVDEPPCPVLVHLKEFELEPMATDADLKLYLDRVGHEMRVVRRLRHPHVAAVIGHFRTAYSLVQVSDWFEGRALEDRWPDVAALPLGDKFGLMLKLAEALAYCHDQGVLHRNLIASNLLLGEDLAEIRLAGFEFARDLDATQDITRRTIERRDERSRPPECWQLNDAGINARLGDIFQLGVIFYRLLENGAWPFESTEDYATDPEATARPWSSPAEPGSALDELRALVLRTLALEPAQRPQLVTEIVGQLSRVRPRIE